MLCSSSFPLLFWKQAFQSSAAIISRIPLHLAFHLAWACFELLCMSIDQDSHVTRYGTTGSLGQRIMCVSSCL